MTVEEAQKKISEILAQLERDTESIVESICVDDLDTTSLANSRRRIRRAIRIQTYPVPGMGWD